MNVLENMREVALGANSYHLRKMLERSPELSKYNTPEFIDRAAKWNYRTFGFGSVSLDAYLDHLYTLKNSRLHNIDVKLWYKIINEVFKRDNYTCSYCGQIGGKLECDHIHPFSKGGTNDLENLTTACRRCNRQKKNKTVEEFNKWKESKL